MPSEEPPALILQIVAILLPLTLVMLQILLRYGVKSKVIKEQLKGQRFVEYTLVLVGLFAGPGIISATVLALNQPDIWMAIAFGLLALGFVAFAYVVYVLRGVFDVETF